MSGEAGPFQPGTGPDPAPRPVVVQFGEVGGWLPAESEVERWIAGALGRAPGSAPQGEIVVRAEASGEMARLNREFMGKEGATNVLAFPAEIPPGPWEPILGDIVICPEVVAGEAADQGKPAESHWAHMVVHGTLHLLGYDHQEDEQAREMEGLERAVLEALGYPDPYPEE